MPVVLQFPGLPPSSVPTLGGGVGVNAQIIAGDQQSAIGGSLLPVTLQVLVTDQLGKPLLGQSVTYIVTSGGGSLSGGGVATTDSRGVAAVSWTLGSTIGLQTVSVNPHTGQTLGFSATATQQISASLSTVTATSPVATGAISTVTITVRDTFGNPVVGVRPLFTPSHADALSEPGNTNSSGVATGIFSNTTAADSVVVVTVNGVTLTQQPTVQIIGSVSASLSTVSASTPVNVNTLDTVTVTAKDSASHLLSGKTVTLSVSGTGNTVNQPGSPTDGAGIATGSFSSSVAESKVVTATAGGVVITQQPTVVVQASGASPIYTLNFEGYANTAALVADTGSGKTFTAEDVNIDTTTCTLSTSIHAPGLTKSMAFNYTKDIGQITRDVNLPSTLKESWIESIEQGTAGFTIAAEPGYIGEPAWKHFFGRINPGPRFAFGTIPNQWLADYPPGGFDLPIDWSSSWDPGDGVQHTYRYHWKASTTPTSADGVVQVWMDGMLLVTASGLNMSDNGGNTVAGIYGLSIGQNFNSGPIQAQSWYWCSFKVWSTNPGW